MSSHNNEPRPPAAASEPQRRGAAHGADVKPASERPPLTVNRQSQPSDRREGRPERGLADSSERPSRRLPPLRRALSVALSLALAAVVATGLALFVVLNPDPSYPPPGQDAPAVPNEILVDFRDDVDPAQIEQLGSSLGIAFVFRDDPLKRFNIYLGRCPPARRGALIEALSAHDWVEFAEPNFLVEAHFKPNDPDYSKQWHLSMIGLETAWEATQGQGAKVAVVDSGVRSNDLANNRKVKDLDAGHFLQGYDFVDDDPVAQDYRGRVSGHGTHVAGTIAQATDNGLYGAGIAYRATLLPVRVLGKDGGTSDGVANGILYAADQGVDLINLSLGSKYRSKTRDKAVRYAYDKGIALIASTGNDGAAVGYPAALKETIAVAAVGPTGEVAPYSNFGPEVDIAAPGGDLSIGPQAGVWQNLIRNGQDALHPLQGTSMAAPHVTGVAALLVSLGVDGDPERIRNILQKTAQPKGDSQHYGAGLLDAAAAVNEVIPARPSPGAPVQAAALVPLHLAPIASLLFFGLAWPRKGDPAPLQTTLETSLAFAVGIALPTVIERLVGSGSNLNILGHSLLVPALLFFSGRFAARHLRPYLVAFSAGLVVHFIADLGTHQDPFAFSAAWVAALFLAANIVAGCLLLFRWVARHPTAAGPAGPA